MTPTGTQPNGSSTLVLVEIDDDLIVRCGVDTDRDPPDTWLDTIKGTSAHRPAELPRGRRGRPRRDRKWSFRDGRIFASVGSADDESDPNSGHGWLCRLVDSEALGAAGFTQGPQGRGHGVS